MRNSFLRLALYVLAVLLSVVKPIYDLTRMTLPAACQPFDGAVWLGFAPLIVAVLLIPIAIITERSNNHQSGLIVSLLSIVTIILGFANVYASVAEDIHALRAGRPTGPRAYASVEDGAIGIKFILAAIESSAAEGTWTDATLDV